MNKLTSKQQMFADEYLIDLNATQAAIRAGYSKKTARFIGNENLTKPNIKDYIEKRMAEKEDELIAKQDEVLQFITSVMRGEITEQTLIGLGEGEQGITNIDVAANQRIKAAELLGKRYAMWTDKQEVSGDLGVTFVDDIGSDPSDD